MLHRSLSCLAAAALAAASSLACAQQVGRVILAAGEAFAERGGREVRLALNSPVEAKDVLRTGPASSLQVHFADQAIMSLRENTRLAVSEYRFAGKEDGTERAAFRLLRGGLRAVTGLIGRANHDNYSVQTETSTIGIRGTDYALRDCRGDCGPQAKDGLYGTVLGLSHGTNRITLRNQRGVFEFGVNEHFFLVDGQSAPQPLIERPGFVSFRPQGRALAAQQGGAGSGGERPAGSSGAQSESRPQSVALGALPQIIQVGARDPFQQTESTGSDGTPVVVPRPEPPIEPTGNIGFVAVDDGGLAAGFATAGQFVTAVQGTGPGVRVLTAFNDLVNQLDPPGASGTVGSLPVVDAGCISPTLPGCFASPDGSTMTAFWGRWQDGTITDAGGTRTFNSAAGTSMGLHYLAGFDLTPYDAITAKSGVATFVPIAGTVPTNSFGQAATSHFVGDLLVAFGATPHATLTALEMGWSPSTQLPSGQQYSFSHVPLTITPQGPNRVAAISFAGIVNGSCLFGCANPNTLLQIQGGFAGPAADHAGLAINTLNGSVATGQVRLFKEMTGPAGPAPR